VKQLRAAVFGASGYSGGELVRLLERHPNVTLAKAFARSMAGELVGDVLPGYSSAAGQRFEEFTTGIELDAEICFLALPHGEAMEIAPGLLDRGKIVIDLSGDHRLTDRALFEKYYKRPQSSPEEVLHQAVYGLPEWNSEAIQNARFIANPGCYATSVILALAPLVAEGAIEAEPIVVNSMSGVSGAGKKASIEYSFAEVNENVKAYRLGDHQHIPEMETVLGGLGAPVSLTFTPHLIPVTRGIYTTICARLSSDLSEFELQGIFTKYYETKPFVRFRADRIPEIRRTTGTNFIDLYAQLLPEHHQVMIISTLDNLMKGAAGQAVQNMNLVCGFPETEGLL